jgi:bacterioferritin-associated ferredoxin
MVSQAVYTSHTLKNDPATNPLDKLPSILKKNLDRNLCTCNEVLKMDIINAIVDGATTVGEIKKQTYATMGTGCCTKQVERLIECLCSPESQSKTPPGTTPEAPTETEK